MLVFFAAVVLVLTSLDDGDDTNTSTTHREPRGLFGPRDKNDSYCGTGNAITAGLPLYLSAVPPVTKKKQVLACLLRQQADAPLLSLALLAPTSRKRGMC